MRSLTRFPQYAFASQVQNHGFDPKDAIIEIAPREGEFWLRKDDILDVIEKEGSKIALVLFGGLSHHTGQWYPMESITKAAKAKVRYHILKGTRCSYRLRFTPRDASVGGTWARRWATFRCPYTTGT